MQLKNLLKDFSESRQKKKSSIQMTTNSRFKTEHLLNNIIDKDFEDMLLPLQIIPTFYLMPQFKIINRFITPEHGVSYYIKTVFGCILLVLGHIYRFNHYFEAYRPFGSGIVNCILYFDLVYFFIFSIVTHIANAKQRNNVVELIIKLQHILKYIHIDEERFLCKHKYQNWLSVLIVCSVYFIHWFLGEELNVLEFLMNLILSLPVIIFDIHVIIAVRTVVLIKNELLAWNQRMEEYKKIYAAKKEEFKNFAVSENDMLDAYVTIVTAFNLCNKVYQFLFTFFALQTFTHVLITVENVIELGNSRPTKCFFQTAFEKVLTVVWNIKSLILMVGLSTASENFYRSVKIAESLCAEILSYGPATGMRITCKNVLRLNRAALHKLSACGFFELDAAFPLRLLSVLVTYTVVLLQFAFLS